MMGNRLLNVGGMDGLVTEVKDENDYQFAQAYGLYDESYGNFYYLPDTPATQDANPDDSIILATQQYAKKARCNGGFATISSATTIDNQYAWISTDNIELKVNTSTYTVTLTAYPNTGRRLRFYMTVFGNGNATVTIASTKGVNSISATSQSTSSTLQVGRGKCYDVWYNGTTWLYVQVL